MFTYLYACWIIVLLLLSSYDDLGCTSFLINDIPRHHCLSSALSSSSTRMRLLSTLRNNDNTNENNISSSISNKKLPKVIIFDLDGCIWKPEMYELLYLMGGYGSPFTTSPENPDVMLTCNGQPVYLLGNIREIMSELYTSTKWKNTLVGISSRTNEPNWAHELLDKFIITTNGDDKKVPATINEKTRSSTNTSNDTTANNSFVLRDVINGPIQIASDSKIDHFYRIQQQTSIELKDMIFYDNELGNCQMVASLGVTVGYCPNGITKDIWDATLHAFSATSTTASGQIVKVP